MLASLHRALARLVAVFRSRDLDRELEHELASHVEMLVEEHLRRGATPEEAARLARIELGGTAELREAHRDARGVPFFDALRQDVRYAYRALRHDAGFTAFTVLVLGLGVGAAVTVFCVVNALLLRPLPFASPDRLVWIANLGGDGVAEYSTQVNHFLDLRDRDGALADMAAYRNGFKPGDTTLSEGGETIRLNGVRVSQGLFSVLGVAPALGRTFTAEECAFDAPGAAVLGHDLWERQYGSDPGVVGRTVTIGDRPTTIVGVAPASFDFASVFAPGTHVDVFLPMPLTEETNRNGNTLAIVGRLAPGATVEGARAETVTIAADLVRQHPERNPFRPGLVPLAEHVTRRLRTALAVLASAVGIVMLIVWANVGSLQMARTVARRKETAVRAAIGAGRGRLIRQTLTESVLLACCGALVGVGLAAAGTRLLAGLSAFDIPLLSTVRVDASALAFAAIVAALTGLLFGLAPAIQASSLGVQDALKDAGRGATGSARHARIRGLLVVSEIAFACVLLVGAGLLARSLLNVLDVRLGFQPERASALRVDPGAEYASRAQRDAYFDRILERARAIPGVEDVGLADVLPLAGDRSWDVTAEGKVYPPGEYPPEGYIRVVSDGYLEAMGIDLREGRGFTEQDTPESEPVAVVNETLARTLWPGEDPIGRIVVGEGTKNPGRRVVGVVADVRHSGLEQGPGCELYFPIRQTDDYGSVYLVVRSGLAPAELAASARAALKPVAPELSVKTFRSMRSLVDESVSPRRFVVGLIAGFSAFALVLAALGVYAVVSYSVRQREHEIGIRMALGARPRDVLRLVVAQGMALALVGLTAGLLGASALSRVVESLLFGVSASDLATYAGGVALLAAVALAACLAPALRASRVDPLVALRHD